MKFYSEIVFGFLIYLEYIFLILTIKCDDWLEWMSSQIQEVQRLRAEAGEVDSNSADYGPKLLDLFQTMSKEQDAISSKFIFK